MASRASAPFRAVGRALKAGAAAAFHFGGQWASRGLTFVPSYLSGLLWLLSQKFLDLAREGYGGNSAVYACLKLLSQAVAEPPLVAYTTRGDGKRGDPLPYDHPLCKLIRQPNPLMSEYELWELTTLYQNIGGRAIWWKERSTLGEIIALWPLRPDRVGPIYTSEPNAPEQVLVGWSYLVPGTTHYVPIRARDVWMSNFPDVAGESGGMVEGLGPLAVLAAEVGADNEATRFVGSMLANYGTPGVVLTTEDALNSKEDVDAIKSAWRQEFGGVRRGTAAVIDSKTTINQVGFNLQQLEFPSLRRVAESRIAAAFGTPAILVGLQVGLESGIRATIAEQRQYFAETTLANHWRRDADSFERDVASEFGEGIECAFDTRQVKALQEQTKQEVDKIADGFKAGAVTLDEFREKVLGLPKLGGDQGEGRVLPRGAIVVDADGNEIGPPPPPPLVPPQDGQHPPEGTPPKPQAPPDDHAENQPPKRGRAAA